MNKPGFSSFFRDKKGSLVIFQPPNPPIIAAAFFLIMAGFTDGLVGGLMRFGFLFCLFIWAVLEITRGVNGFRRMLGWLVFAGVFVWYIA